MADETSWNDKRMETLIGILLRSGVLLSALIVGIGGAIYLMRYGHSVTDYRVFRSEPSELRSVGKIFRNALALQGRGIIQLGLLVLIATPVARVAFSIFGFAEEHDHMYVIVAFLVLLILLYSLVGYSWPL
jgi:uncharacterized membrane protein